MNEIVSADIDVQALARGQSRSLLARILGQCGRLRVQIVGGLFFAVMAPALIRGQFERFIDSALNYDSSIIGTTMAFLLGLLIYRKLTNFPGIRGGAYIVPAFAAAFAITLTYFFFLRIDYSRYQFAMSFVLTVSWFYFCFFAAKHVRTLSLAVAPFGSVGGLTELSFVDWKIVRRPDESVDLPLVVDLRAELDEEWERGIAQCALNGRPIYHVKQVYESLSGRMNVEHLSETRFGTLAPTTIYAPAKFYCDWFLAVFALCVSWPLLLITAVIIRLESPGPAIFTQQRMGFGGKPFTIYKFRSMRQQDPAMATLNTEMTMSDDDRITVFGKFIRKTRIDELPQLFNILKGEMSWIGPRPEAMKLSAWYDEQIPFYCYRHLVRPGITGWAQVNQGHITSLDDARTKLEYDFFYVRNLSIWLDALVLLRTVKVILTGKGAK